MALLDPVAAGLEAPPSNLGAVIRQVREVFDAAADTIPVMVGRRYQAATGRAPRILFVPGRGTWGPPVELGYAASVTHACAVYVRGSEDGDDIERWERAYAIADRVLSALRRAAAGRLDGGDYGDNSPADVDFAGAEVSFTFTYQRDVEHQQPILGVASATDATEESNAPGMQAGDAGTIDTADVVTEVSA